MTRPCARLLLLFLIGGTLLRASPGIPWEDFKRRTLQQAIALDAGMAARLPDPGGDLFVLPPGTAPLSKMVVRFSGLARALSPERRTLLIRWAGHRNYAPAYIERYEQEYLFFEGEQKYWLPVQKSVAAQLLRDIREGARVELYVLGGLGGVRTGGTWDWLLLVQEYQLPLN